MVAEGVKKIIPFFLRVFTGVAEKHIKNNLIDIFQLLCVQVLSRIYNDIPNIIQTTLMIPITPLNCQAERQIFTVTNNLPSTYVGIWSYLCTVHLYKIQFEFEVLVIQFAANCAYLYLHWMIFLRFAVKFFAASCSSVYLHLRSTNATGSLSP